MQFSTLRIGTRSAVRVPSNKFRQTRAFIKRIFITVYLSLANAVPVLGSPQLKPESSFFRLRIEVSMPLCGTDTQHLKIWIYRFWC